MFTFKNLAVFEAEQMTRDTAVQLPHLAVLVPAGDWVISEVETIEGGGVATRQVLHLTNAMFRDLCEPVDDAGDAQLAAAVPVYLPAPGPEPESAAVEPPVLGADA